MTYTSHESTNGRNLLVSFQPPCLHSSQPTRSPPSKMNPWYIISVPIRLPRIVSHRDHLLQISYAPGSPERAALQAAIAQLEQDLPFEVPVIINGEPVSQDHCMCLWTATYDFGLHRSRRASLPNS